MVPTFSHQKKPSQFQSEAGFALIITIALMAFLVLLLVSLTVITRVETQSVSNSQQVNIARENAILALNVAVGQLQRYAGPDQVVTSHANIDPAFDNNPWWTGVWDEGAGIVTWLVSGNETNPLQVTPNLSTNSDGSGPTPPDEPITASIQANWVRLVGSNSTNLLLNNNTAVQIPTGGVMVPRVPLRTTNFPGLGTAAVTTGHFGYWVGDEGTKASYALKERHLETYAHLDSLATQVEYDEARRQLRQLMGQRNWFSFLNTAFSPNPQLEIVRDFRQFDLRLLENERMASIISRGQYQLPFRSFQFEHPTAFHFDGRNDLPNQNDLRLNFHALTPRNHGVIASPNFGGLKLDLSNQGGIAQTGWSTEGQDDFWEFLRYARTNLQPPTPQVPNQLQFPMREAATDTPTVDEPVFSVAPVVSEFVFRYAIYTQPGGIVHVRVETQAEIWNPYNFALETEPMLFVLRDLPEIEVTDSVSDTTLIVSLSESFANFNLVLPTSIPAGSVQTSTVLQGDFQALDGDGNPVQFIFPPALPPSTVGQLTLEVPETYVIRGELWRLTSPAGIVLGTDPSVPTGVPLAWFECRDDNGDPYSEFLVPEYSGSDNSYRFAFHARLIDSVDNQDWLEEFDPRQLGLTNAFVIEDDASAVPTRSLNAGTDPHRLRPAANVAQPVVTLFEIPLQDSVSLAALQHLQFHNRPAYALGNNWGGQINDLFDRFFLSTIPQDHPTFPSAGWGFPLANTRHVHFRDNNNYDLENNYNETATDAPEVAQHLLVEGMFNINSTSINAWRSVLGSVNIRGSNTVNDYNPDPDDNLNPNGLWWAGSLQWPLTHGVFRFSQTGDMIANYVRRANQNQLNDPSQLQTLENQPNAAFNQGVRELTPDELVILATEIVREIRAQGRPFYSLAEFVNSQVLANAILNAGINGSLPPQAPSFITEGDILTALAPYMAARSDTFLVRTYGDSFNPVTNRTVARAYLEALVQRVPTPHDPGDDIVNPTGQFGRKFEVVYFRWLSPGDI